jgi:hypothetical protein
MIIDVIILFINIANLEIFGLLRTIVTYRYNLNYGPNLFFASFIILLIALLAFVIVHRVNEFI